MPSSITKTDTGASAAAPERDTFAMRFLRIRDVAQFTMTPSPHNRGGAGRLPTSESETLAMINALRADGAEPLTQDQIWCHFLEAANTNFVSDRYMFLGEDTLRNIAQDACAGFAFMNSHRTGSYSRNAELPMGRTFCGRFERIAAGSSEADPDGDGDGGGGDSDNDGDGARSRVVVGIYMLRGKTPNGASGPTTDDLHDMIDGGTVFDCSVGLFGGDYLCDVCGYGVYEYEPYDPETDTGGYYLCPHIPGSTYRMTRAEVESQIARGVSDGCCTATLSGAHCGEVSAVYDGAVPGAGFNKALRFAASGDVPEQNLAELATAYPVAAQTFTTFSSTPTRSDFGRARPAATRGNGDADMSIASPSARRPAAGKLTLSERLVAFAARHGLARNAPIADLAKAADAAGEDFAALIADDVQELGTQELTTASTQPDPAVLALQARTEQLERELKQEREQRDIDRKAAQLAADKAFILELKREFKITPTQGDDLEALATTNPAAFSALAPILEKAEPIDALAGRRFGADGEIRDARDAAIVDGGAASDALFAQLQELTNKYLQANPDVSQSEAFGVVCRQNKDLAARYRKAVSEGK